MSYVMSDVMVSELVHIIINDTSLYVKVGDTVIGTHFIDLSTISHDGDKGKYVFGNFDLTQLLQATCQHLVLHLSICTGPPGTTA